jgi:hypothetical protein
MHTNLSEEHAATILRVKVCRVKNWFGYTGMLKGRQLLRPAGGGKKKKKGASPGPVGIMRQKVALSRVPCFPHGREMEQ